MTYRPEWEPVIDLNGERYGVVAQKLISGANRCPFCGEQTNLAFCSKGHVVNEAAATLAAEAVHRVERDLAKGMRIGGFKK